MTADRHLMNKRASTTPASTIPSATAAKASARATTSATHGPGGVASDAGAVDLDAYCERIGYTGDLKPTLETLQGLCIRHVQTFPFENVDPLLGNPVRLDIASLQEKMVRQGRGGYCFEQNLLFQHVLEAIGFPVTGLGARVILNAQSPRPRTHMLLNVEVDGTPHIVDVGFGGMTLTGPIRLEPDVVQETPHEPHRLLHDGRDYFLQAKVRDEWKTLFRFDLSPQELPDFEMANWYVSNHPDSHFTFQLSAARPIPTGRYALRNNLFTVHHLGGPSERQRITSADELRETLEGPFRLHLPDDPKVDALLERLTQAAD